MPDVDALTAARTALIRLGPLPRVLHATWKTRIDVFNHDNALIKHGLRGFAEANPGWRIEVSNDEDMDGYLRRKLRRSDYNLTRHVHPVEKSDLWRLVKLYHEGGIYSDVDRLHNRRVQDVASVEAKVLLPAFHPTWAPRKFDFAQDFMGTAAYNPMLYQALDLALKRRRRCEASRGRFTVSATTGQDVSQRGGCSIFSLGPLTYFEACTKFLFGRPLARNPDEATLSVLLKQLAALAPMVVTYNDTPPFHTMMFRPNPTYNVFGVSMNEDHWRPRAIKRWEASKDALYRESNLPESALKRKKNIDLGGPGMGGPSAWTDLGNARKKGMAAMFRQSPGIGTGRYSRLSNESTVDTPHKHTSEGCAAHFNGLVRRHGIVHPHDALGRLKRAAAHDGGRGEAAFTSAVERGLVLECEACVNWDGERLQIKERTQATHPDFFGRLRHLLAEAAAPPLRAYVNTRDNGFCHVARAPASRVLTSGASPTELAPAETLLPLHANQFEWIDNVATVTSAQAWPSFAGCAWRGGRTGWHALQSEFSRNRTKCHVTQTDRQCVVARTRNAAFMCKKRVCPVRTQEDHGFLRDTQCILAVDGNTYATIFSRTMLAGRLAVRIGGWDATKQRRSSSFEWWPAQDHGP